jgi:hypothetical protein
MAIQIRGNLVGILRCRAWWDSTKSEALYTDPACLKEATGFENVVQILLHSDQFVNRTALNLLIFVLHF